MREYKNHAAMVMVIGVPAITCDSISHKSRARWRWADFNQHGNLVDLDNVDRYEGDELAHIGRARIGFALHHLGLGVHDAGCLDARHGLRIDQPERLCASPAHVSDEKAVKVQRTGGWCAASAGRGGQRRARPGSCM